MVEVYFMVRVVLTEADTLAPGERLLSRLEAAAKRAVPDGDENKLEFLKRSATLKEGHVEGVIPMRSR